MTVSVDVDRTVGDTIHLESLPGAVERLLQQCHDIGAPGMTAIRRIADSVVLEFRGGLRQLAGLRMYSALSVVLGDYEENRKAGFEPAVEALRRSWSEGVLSAVGVEGPGPAFRVDPLPDRDALRESVEAGLGWKNDPRSWHVNLTREADLLLAQVGALYYSSRFPAMKRVPASTTPVLAALLVQFLKPQRGNVVYDPFCGSGTLLVEASAADLDLVLLGSDVSGAALGVAMENHHLFPCARLIRADASRLPVATGSVDRVVSNLPFGKRVGSHAANSELYPAFLAELTRVLRTDGRAVLLTEDKNLFRGSVEATRSIRLLREIKLATGGLHPSAFVLERTRAARQKAKAERRQTPQPARRH